MLKARRQASMRVPARAARVAASCALQAADLPSPATRERRPRDATQGAAREALRTRCRPRLLLCATMRRCRAAATSAARSWSSVSAKHGKAARGRLTRNQNVERNKALGSCVLSRGVAASRVPAGMGARPLASGHTPSPCAHSVRGRTQPVRAGPRGPIRACGAPTLTSVSISLRSQAHEAPRFAGA